MKKFFSKVRVEIVFIYVELKKTFSNEPSFFSSKRIERFILFISAIFAANYWFATHVDKVLAEHVIAYIIMLLTAVGYNMRQTQKEKQCGKKPPEE